jgi:glycosyltransferase involved in cell wall biosynthesis
LIDKVIQSIDEFTVGEYELIVVIDGCTDNSEEVVMKTLESTDIDYTIVHTPDVFETKANNAGIKKATGDYVIIIQDDMVIEEGGWNRRMQKPFIKFDDVFAVTARTAHNYRANTNSVHLGMEEDLDNCWCDILQSCDEADVSNTPRDTFAVRATVNRGPLMINLKDLKKLKYLDETYSPQDMDDHDLMFRAHKELGKVCGLYPINVRSDNDWGGTRVNGEPASWLLKTHHKNSKIFYERNHDILEDRKVIVNRKVS